jgi:class 3 adenylate cyclase
LLLEGNQVRVEACATTGADDPAKNHPASAYFQLRFSPAIVNYVLHTGDDLVLVDPEGDPRFAGCCYLTECHPKSVLCIGIRHQGELLGAVYLEHTQLSGIFSDQKLEWLRILTTELGLTVWSGRLGRYRDFVSKFAPAVVSQELDRNPTSPDLAIKNCDASILFADLAGYTRMGELVEPQQLDHLINRSFSRFVDEVNRFGGVVLEVRGDEIFALFQDEDRTKHAWKAVSAALAITREAAKLNAEFSNIPVPILMNIGINSGNVAVGVKAVEASSGPRWRYGASGSVVNIAARVRELARDGSILVTSDSIARGLSDFMFEDIGEHLLKNVMSPVRLYRLIGERR